MPPARTPAARVFRKQRPPVGARPGTLAIPPGSPAPEIRVWCYDAAGVEERRLLDVEELAPYLESARTTWVDVRGLGDERVLRRLGELFSLHPLALEDAVNVPQRAKAEIYEGHHLLVARMPLVGEDGSLDVPQVALSVASRHLLTIQERSFGFFDPVRERLREGLGPIRSLGPDYLAYALVDTLVDRYYPIAERLAHALEDLEDEATADAGPDLLPRIHRCRRQLVILRRIGRPQREAIRELLVSASPFVSEEVRTYLRDTHDHIAQAMDLVDSSHEMAIGIVDVHLSHVSHRTNEVIKVLTLMASIFIPLTFLAGIYGMNFEFIPGLHSRWAYPALLLAMAGLAGAMLLYFRRRGWLGSRRGK